MFNYIQTKLFESFYTQKMANSFPLWSRIRNDPISIGQRVIGSFAPYIEDLFRLIRREKSDTFVNTIDAYFAGMVYAAEIPYTITPIYLETIRGSIRDNHPIKATHGSIGDIDLLIAEDLEQFQNITPSRISMSSESYDVDYILNSTVENIGSAAINEIPHANWIHMIVRNGQSFGDFTDEDAAYPASIMVEGLLKKDIESYEARVFLTNDIARTRKIFADIESVEVDNIDPDATIYIDSWGFNLPHILDRAVSYSIPESRRPRSLYYSLETDSNDRSLLIYNTKILDDVVLQSQGLSGFNDQQVAYFVEESDPGSDFSYEHLKINDIAKMDMDLRIYAVSDNNLYIFESLIPAFTNEVEMNQQIMEMRTTSPHVGLEMKPLSLRNFRIDEAITLSTRLKVPVSSFTKPVRCRIGYEGPDSNFIYLKENGTTTVNGDDAWRYNPISERGTSKWSEIKWKFQLSQGPVGMIPIFLETQFLNNVSHPVRGIETNKIEYDLMFIGHSYLKSVAKFPLSSSLIPATGITFDSDNHLWIKSLATGSAVAHRVNLHHDIALFDFDANRMYFREEYDDVTVGEATIDSELAAIIAKLMTHSSFGDMGTIEPDSAVHTGSTITDVDQVLFWKFINTSEDDYSIRINKCSGDMGYLVVGEDFESDNPDIQHGTSSLDNPICITLHLLAGRTYYFAYWQDTIDCPPPAVAGGFQIELETGDTCGA
tara:strand:- start:76175 stop:78319 length:2145 start_codon:yes stop_codon:yes gene_type:complete